MDDFYTPVISNLANLAENNTIQSDHDIPFVYLDPEEIECA